MDFQPILNQDGAVKNDMGLTVVRLCAVERRGV